MGFKLMAGAVASCALIGVAVGCLIHRYLFTVNGERGTDVAIRFTCIISLIIPSLLVKASPIVTFLTFYSFDF